MQLCIFLQEMNIFLSTNSFWLQYRLIYVYHVSYILRSVDFEILISVSVPGGRANLSPLVLFLRRFALRKIAFLPYSFSNGLMAAAL